MDNKQLTKKGGRMARVIKIKIKGSRAVPFMFKDKRELRMTLKNVISKKDYSEDKRRFNILVNSIWNVGRGFWPSEEVSSGMMPGVKFRPNHKVKPLVLPPLKMRGANA